MLPVVILLLGAHLAYAELHSLQYFYTGTAGLADFPQFVAVGMVDGKQIDYYDSIIGKNVLKQAWMEGTRDESRITDIRRGHQATFSSSVKIVMDRFNQTLGVHTVQRMYGCEWDDQTGETNGFHQFGYDGEDFVSLELKEMRYISPVQQGIPTVQKWNNDRGFIESGKNYLGTECIEWLKKYVQYGKSSLEKTVSPQVSLLQKSSSSAVTCHATGFYPSGVTISWMRNGQDHHEDVNVGELLPNEDGTFQKTSTIRVTPDELKKNKFSCVVEHQGKTMTADEITTNPGAPVPFGIIFGVVAGVILLVVFAFIGFMVWRQQRVSNSSCPLSQSTAELTITKYPQQFTTSSCTTKINISEQEKALITKKPDDGNSSSSSLTAQDSAQDDREN